MKHFMHFHLKKDGPKVVAVKADFIGELDELENIIGAYNRDFSTYKCGAKGAIYLSYYLKSVHRPPVGSGTVGFVRTIPKELGAVIIAFVAPGYLENPRGALEAIMSDFLTRTSQKKLGEIGFNPIKSKKDDVIPLLLKGDEPLPFIKTHLTFKPDERVDKSGSITLSRNRWTGLVLGR